MNLSKYEVLVKTVELGSLTKAANTLGYTQSGVSHILKSLETEFGFPLLIRNKSDVRLTDKGEQIYRQIREVLHKNEILYQTIASIQGKQYGSITIASFSSIVTHWLPSIIQIFENQNPDVEINIIDGVYDEVEEWITSEKADCGFVTLPTYNNFDTIPLYKDRLLAVLPKNHPLGSLEYFPMSALKKQDFIMPGEGSHYDIGRIISKKIHPKIRFSFRDDFSAIAMVEKGLGITILPELVLKGNTKNLIVKELDTHEYRTIGLAITPSNKKSPLVKCFLSNVQNWLHSDQEANSRIFI